MNCTQQRIHFVTFEYTFPSQIKKTRRFVLLLPKISVCSFQGSKVSTQNVFLRQFSDIFATLANLLMYFWSVPMCLNQCYKYRVGEYIAKGPKRNYRIYRQKCQQTSAIYRQNKKYKNIKKYKKRKKSSIFEKIGKYRQKSANIIIKSANIARKSGKIAKKNGENIGAIFADFIASELTSQYITMLPIYRRYL